MFIVVLGAVSFLGGFCVVQHRMLSRSVAESDSLRQQLEQSRRETAKVPAPSTDARNGLAQSQFSELLRLRGEVTQLRQQTNDIAKLREENEKLRARASVSANAVEETNAAPGAEIHERDSWVFAGYNSPENTVQSLIWAFSQTNKEAFLACIDSNSDDYASMLNDTNFDQKMSEQAAELKSFRFGAPTRMFGNFSEVSVYVDNGENPSGKPTELLLKKNGDSWQLVGGN